MTPEEMEVLLKANPSKRELMVFLAMKLGYLDTYGIQQVTGLRRDVVIDTAQNMQSLLRKRVINIYNLNVVPAQNVQTPPQALLDYLNRKLEVHTNNRGRDLKVMKQAYLVAYEKAQRNQRDAILLVKDYIDVNLEALKSKYAPAPYLLAGFKSYVRSIPELPLAAWERAQAKKVRFRYNNITKKWEEA